MGGWSIQVLGFKRSWLSHKKSTCPKVLLFSDMDISTTSRAEGLCVVLSEKGRGLSPGLSMRKVMRFNL